MSEVPRHLDVLDQLSTSHERSALLDPEQSHIPSEEEEDEDHAREVTSWKSLPWWKRPSPYWLIFGISVGSMGFSALLAPKIALYTTLVCHVHRSDHVHASRFPTFIPAHNLVTNTAVDVLAPHLSGDNTNESAVESISVFVRNFAYTTSPDHSQNSHDPGQSCASDPEVQAIVAKLNAVFTTSMGILSCIVTGWWGSLSDRYGRRTVVFAAVFGLFATDVIHIISMWFADVLPGKYWFPLISYLIEGLCGSVSTGVAINHAYLADTTHPSTRSRYFSLSLGFEFAGVAIGPVLGGLLIRSTGNILSVFYFSSLLHGIYSIFILLFLPESLTRARARGERLRWKREKAKQTSSGRTFGLSVWKDITRFFSSFVVLFPEQLPDVNDLGQRRKDWSLCFIAVAYGLSMSVTGSLSYKFQYAAARFHWTPEITSYYVSSIGATRAFFLAAILPMIIKYLTRTTPLLPSTPGGPLRDTTDCPPSGSVDLLPDTAQIEALGKSLSTPRSAAVDLTIARVSVGLESTAFLGMATASSGALFTLASAVASCSSGFSPAAQALALDIYTKRRAENRGQVGKLFGSLCVVQALGSQIISPALYGFLYSNTAGVFPQAIMVLSTCTSLLALTFLSLVRILPPKQQSTGDQCGNEQVDRGM